MRLEVTFGDPVSVGEQIRDWLKSAGMWRQYCLGKRFVRLVRWGDRRLVYVVGCRT